MLIADISGYTRFMLAHQKALAHSHMIIEGLLQSIVNEAIGPLKVSRIEGDAVFMYACKNDVDDPAFLGDRVAAIFAAYAEAQGQFVEDAFCKCTACINIGTLGLKIVVHSGAAVVSRNDLSGIAPIVVHRLLKNSVEADEYLLLTDSAREDIQLPPGVEATEGQEIYPDVGTIRTWLAPALSSVEMQCEIRPMVGVHMGFEILRHEIKSEYKVVADEPHTDFHFHTGIDEARNCEYGEDDISVAPQEALDSFAGTGNPFAIRRLDPGEQVLDIGCGAGFDAFIAAHHVGAEGWVVGIDMTHEMLEKARRLATGHDNIEIREGFAEELPVEDGWADVIISNGVFNLCPNKTLVLSEMMRALKPGGRLQIADISVTRAIPEGARRNMDLWTG